jgi:hypothetical protein
MKLPNQIIVVFPEASELKTIVAVSWLGSSVIILVRNHCSMVGNLTQYLEFQVLDFQRLLEDVGNNDVHFYTRIVDRLGVVGLPMETRLLLPLKVIAY